MGETSEREIEGIRERGRDERERNRGDQSEGETSEREIEGIRGREREGG